MKTLPSCPRCLFSAALAALAIACSPAPVPEQDAGPTCVAASSACTADAQCCTGLACVGGVCATPCGAAGATCSAAGACCAGLSCAQGTCACLAEGAACSDGGTVCCGGTSCDATGHCRAPCTTPGACQPFGAACASAADCCAPSACVSGVCADATRTTSCRGEDAPCTTAAECCGSDAVYASHLDCRPGADGGNVCRLGAVGDPCDATRHCASGTDCVVPPNDAGLTVGTCARPPSTTTCIISRASCNAGDACDPESAVNGGYDPCFIASAGGSLGYRATALMCGADGHCRVPVDGEPCTRPPGCLQTPGDPRPTACNRNADGELRCMPSCTTDSECQGSEFQDFGLNSPERLTNYCVRYGLGAGCQPKRCYEEGKGGAIGDVNNLYQPCANTPNSICLPRFVSAATNIVGFCAPVRQSTASTVGQACDARGGLESGNSYCGAGALCLGGRCAALCDAAALGTHGTPTCGADKLCVSPQGLDLISSYQFGGCTDPCHPFTTLEESGCVNACGGAKSRCYWLVGDPVVGQPRGYCGAAVREPIAVGRPCTKTSVDPCESGAQCRLDANGTTRSCVKLCDPGADAGTPINACPAGKRCTAFSSLTRSGYCQ